jgi:hypothetical protein
VIATYTACPNCQRTAGRPEDGQHSPLSRLPADRESLHAFECGDPRPDRAQPDHLCVSPYASIGYFVNLRDAVRNRQRLSRNFLFFFSAVWRWGDSNPRPSRCKRDALPLSYIPGLNCPFCYLSLRVLGFEPRTSALSELRSSQLSYTRVSPTKKPNPAKAWPYPNRIVDRALPDLANSDNVDGNHQLFSGVRGKQNYRTVTASVNGKL